jgi:hypothetical protein
MMSTRRSSLPRRPWRGPWRAGLLLAVGLLAASCAGGPPDDLRVSGPDTGALVSADALASLAFVVASDDPEADLDGVAFTLDGAAVDAVERAGTEVAFRPAALPDGPRTVTATWAKEPGGRARTLATWTFEVDATPPLLEVDAPQPPIVVGAPLVLSGRAEPGARVTAGPLEVEVDETGAFLLDLEAAPAEELTVSARDAAGNVTESSRRIVTVPSRAEVDEVRGVHVTACAWSSPGKRERLLDLAESGRITTFVLTVKGEDGLVGFRWEPFLEVADADLVASACFYDLAAVVAELHGRGIAVVARIVAFRDPVLAAWAWDQDRRDMVIQTPDGEPYRGYGGFVNPAHPDVRDYNIDLAEAAAAAGVDMVLWDYIRRPDGALEGLVFPDMEGTIEETVVAFTAEADERLAPYGVEHGASVYGIAVTRPREIGQDIPGMAEHLDVIAPMIYPSHWGPGEYRIPDPNRAPFDIVARSLADYVSVLDGLRARVVPWLEDTVYRAWDRPLQVREQLRATAEVGIDEWMLWDPGNNYTPDAIPTR